MLLALFQGPTVVRCYEFQLKPHFRRTCARSRLPAVRREARHRPRDERLAWRCAGLDNATVSETRVLRTAIQVAGRSFMESRRLFVSVGRAGSMPANRIKRRDQILR